MTKEKLWEVFDFQTKLRGLSGATAKNYKMYNHKFLEYHEIVSVDELVVEHVQTYLHYLLSEKKLAKGSVNVVNNSIRFLFNNVLDKPLPYNKIPRHRKGRTLPDILTKQEVLILLSSCKNLRDKTILTTVYSAGLRVSEVVKLQVKDIDSEKMQLFINHGKGEKDRFAILSQANLKLLRAYWKEYRPQEYLFYPRGHKERLLGVRRVQLIFDNARLLAGVEKNVGIHSLRHAFATHLLEEGTSIYHIKKLLGHTYISTTCIYLHVANITSMDVKSPMDTLFVEDFGND